MRIIVSRGRVARNSTSMEKLVVLLVVSWDISVNRENTVSRLNAAVFLFLWQQTKTWKDTRSVQMLDNLSSSVKNSGSLNHFLFNGTEKALVFRLLYDRCYIRAWLNGHPTCLTELFLFCILFELKRQGNRNILCSWELWWLLKCCLAHAVLDYFSDILVFIVALFYGRPSEYAKL